jgi:octaprenyl-diphosphate synthase
MSETHAHALPQREVVLETLATASRRQDLDPLALRLLELKALLGADLADVEGAILGLERPKPAEAWGSGHGTLAREAARHLLEQPGKRIRPMCVLLAARAGGLGLTPVVRDLAVACELVHAATLLHDDVIDDGTERRGAPTARVIYGNSASILAGDHLLIEALRLVERSGHPALLSGLLAVISEMVAGEALQLERRGRFDLDPELYLRVIRGKTAALFRWGLHAGATVAGLPEPLCAALGRAGAALGMAFQVVDDVIDLESDPRQSGKNALADLREGKLTWPFLVGAQADHELAARLKGWITTQTEPTPDEAVEVVFRLKKLGALDATRAFAAELGAEARGELRRLPESGARQAIEVVVEAALLRSR